MSYFQTFPSEVIMPTTPASYPSDLSEAQWKLVAPLILVPQSYGRPPRVWVAGDCQCDLLRPAKWLFLEDASS